MRKQDNQPTGTRETAADRRVKALELRKAGQPYRAIGRQLNISEKTAHQDVQRALAHLAELELASADELRTMELARLDMLMLAAMRVLVTTHPYVSGGKVLPNLADDGPKLQAIDRLLRISESRRKLLGLDAAPKVPLNPDGSPAVYAELRAVVLALLPAEQRLLLADALDKVIDAPTADEPSDST